MRNEAPIPALTLVLPVLFVSSVLLLHPAAAWAAEGDDQPVPPVVNPAEWEPMSGVLIRYPGQLPLHLIAEMSKDAEVRTIVADDTQKAAAYALYASNGVHMANCTWLIAPSDTVLTRDYGPWYLFTGDGVQGIADNVYGNPLDDKIPAVLGGSLNIPVYETALFIQGGNYMSDGMGAGMSDEMVIKQNPSLTPEGIKHIMEAYVGLEVYHMLPDIGTVSHVDTWAKLIDPGRILVKRLDPPNLLLEATAEHIAGLMSSYGKPYEVIRIDNTYETGYTNSLILNHKVLVPMFNHPLDSQALNTWAEAMPGYEVIGVPHGGWGPGNALHCRTMGITDRHMLRIVHIPLTDRENDGSGYGISATVHAYSNQPLQPDSPKVVWKTGGGSYAEMTMAHAGGDIYQTFIPEQPDGTDVFYYIEASDGSGRTETHPCIGAGNPHRFFAGPDVAPPAVGFDGPFLMLATDWPLTLACEVRDDRGISSVELEYLHNGIPMGTVPMTLKPLSAVRYEGTLASPPAAPGDWIQLRIKAVDTSMNQNTAHEPPSGYHTIKVARNAQACVWNPSGQPSGRVFYDMLRDSGIQSVYRSETPVQLDAFAKMFVFLGIYPSAYALNQDQTNAVVSYIGSGHDVYLEGGDCWAYHPYHDQLGNAFGITGIDDGDPIQNPILGVDGTFTEGMSYSNTHPSNYIDVIAPKGSAAMIFNHALGGAGVAHETQDHRTVGLSFEFSSIAGNNPESSQQMLFKEILKFFSYALWTDTPTVAVPTGGTVHFSLDAGPDNAGRSYFLLGSATGTGPGLPLPGGLTLPLKWDTFTSLTYTYANTPYFVDFNGILDASGAGTARFETLGSLPPGSAGATLYFAYLLHSPFDFVSNFVAVEIVP